MSKTDITFTSARAQMRGVILPWAAARPIWRMAEAAGHLTPYQSWGWIDAWQHEVVAPRGDKAFVLVVEDANGAPLLALPLSMRKLGPLRAAVIVGGDHANFKFPVLCGRGDGLAQEAVIPAIRAALTAAKADLLLLDNMPLEWEGVANPLAAFLTQASPSMGFKTHLPAGGIEAYIAEHIGNQHRKKLRQKERGLERVAPLRFVRAATEAEVDAILTAFFELKAARFGELGVPDVFVAPGITGFMRRAALDGLAEGAPALVLYALFSGDRVVAIYGGSAQGKRFAASINAMALDDVRRYSPGDLLLLRVLEDCCQRGITTFDLGLGGSSYKTTYCPIEEPVFDGMIAVGRIGWLFGHLWLARRVLKTRLKRYPRVIAFLQGLRRLGMRSNA